MIFQFKELSKADLIPGAIYKGGDYKNPMKDDPLSKIFKIEGYKKGIGNQGILRKTFKEKKGKILNGTVAFLVMIDNGEKNEWHNCYYNEKTSIFTYYRDNRTLENNILKDKNLGKKMIYDMFNKSYLNTAERKKIPPIIIEYVTRVI